MSNGQSQFNRRCKLKVKHNLLLLRSKRLGLNLDSFNHQHNGYIFTLHNGYIFTLIRLQEKWQLTSESSLKSEWTCMIFWLKLTFMMWNCQPKCIHGMSHHIHVVYKMPIKYTWNDVKRSVYNLSFCQPNRIHAWMWQSSMLCSPGPYTALNQRVYCTSHGM